MVYCVGETLYVELSSRSRYCQDFEGHKDQLVTACLGISVADMPAGVLIRVSSLSNSPKLFCKIIALFKFVAFHSSCYIFNTNSHLGLDPKLTMGMSFVPATDLCSYM